MNKKFKKERKSSKKPFVFESVNTDGIVSDVDGAYTGCPVDGGEPQQDVDDL